MRENFEKWYQSSRLYTVDFSMKCEKDEYISSEVNRSWKAWQAGISYTQEKNEPVAEVVYNVIHGDSKLGGISWLGNKWDIPIGTKLYIRRPFKRLSEDDIINMCVGMRDAHITHIALSIVDEMERINNEL